MATTSKIAVTEGAGLNVATYSIATEDAMTKQFQRVVLADNAGADTGVVASPAIVSGAIVDNAADSGNPVKVGGKYNSATQTYANGDRADMQMDVAGRVITSQGTLISGEDQTNDVLKVEGQFLWAYLTADGQVKSSAGFLHTVTFSPTDAAATGGTIILYDQTTEAVPILFTYYVPAIVLVPVTVILDVKFSTGLYVGFTTTADVCVTVSYR